MQEAAQEAGRTAGWSTIVICRTTQRAFTELTRRTLIATPISGWRTSWHFWGKGIQVHPPSKMSVDANTVVVLPSRWPPAAAERAVRECARFLAALPSAAAGSVVVCGPRASAGRALVAQGRLGLTPWTALCDDEAADESGGEVCVCARWGLLQPSGHDEYTGVYWVLLGIFGEPWALASFTAVFASPYPLA